MALARMDLSLKSIVVIVTISGALGTTLFFPALGPVLHACLRASVSLIDCLVDDIKKQMFWLLTHPHQPTPTTTLLYVCPQIQCVAPQSQRYRLVELYSKIMLNIKAIRLWLSENLSASEFSSPFWVWELLFHVRVIHLPITALPKCAFLHQTNTAFIFF